MLFYKFFLLYKILVYKLFNFHCISINLTWPFSFEIYIYNNMCISSVTFELMLIVILILLWIRRKKYILGDYSFEEGKSVSFVTFSFFFTRNCLWRKKYEHSDFQLYLRISSKIYWNRTLVYILANWYK